MIQPRPTTLSPLRVLGDEVRILLNKADSPTRTAAALVEAAPGNGVPPHTHAEEEECYFLLDGTLEMTVGSETMQLERGGFAHVPPHTIHAYQNRSGAVARFLVWTVGGSIDEFFRELDRTVRRMPDDLPALQRAMQKHGIVPVGDAFGTC
jgi:quercetin dioxygenase-like cupin family protein